jgi:putative transcriptional regulator
MSIHEVRAMDDSLVLKNRLKEYRKELNLSQDELAKMVGVSRNTISSIETGQFCPTAKLALVICIALDKKFEDVFYF